MKTTYTATTLLFAAVLTASAFAAGPDPTGDRETIARDCLTKAGFTEARTLPEYEAVRYSKAGYFYFGTRIWISFGSDQARAQPCLDKVGAKK